MKVGAHLDRVPHLVQLLILLIGVILEVHSQHRLLIGRILVLLHRLPRKLPLPWHLLLPLLPKLHLLVPMLHLLLHLLLLLFVL